MQEIHLKPRDLCLPLPLRAILVGPSGSGKSETMLEMLRYKDRVFYQPYDKFIFCSPNLDSELSSPRDAAFRQRLVKLAEPQEIAFYDHIITLEELNEESGQGSQRLLVFIDDFSDQIFEQNVAIQLFLRLSSHQGIDTVCALHHASAKSGGKNYGPIWNSANVIVLFRSLADRAHIGALSRKMFPYSQNFLEKCLSKSTELLGNYANITIFCNLDNDLNKSYSVRANIFSEDIILFKNPMYYAAG